jgi:HK97 family phage portal protein
MARPMRTTSRMPYGAVRTFRRGVGGLAPASDWAYLTGDTYPTTLGPATEREAMGLPPFGRGVALLCSAVAETDWRAVRWDPVAGVAIRRPDQPQVLRQPDPYTTVWHYRWAAVEDLILYGNHFALCGPTDLATRRPGSLVPIPADLVGVLVDPEDGRVWLTVNGEARRVYDPVDPVWASVESDGRALGHWDAASGEPAAVFHISAGGRSGEVLGLGVLEQYGAWLGGAVAAEHHAGSYFAGGALPPAVLQSPQALTQTQAQELKDKWRSMVTTREPVILPSGYVLTPIASDALNAQLVESRQWNAAAVAMILGIPSYKLGLSGPSMTYQNIESADIEWVRDSVDRYAGPIAASFSTWLMPEGTSVAWDYAGRLRSDAKTTAEVVTAYVGAEVLTVDEGRAMIGRPPLETPSTVPAVGGPDPGTETDPEGGAPGSAPEQVDGTAGAMVGGTGA